MSNSNLPQYTFLSWYRKGLVNYITNVDSPTATSPVGMPSITFELELNNANTVQKNIDIIGPGHISGINERVMIKTFPQEKVKNAEFPNLAYVEFYDEDFPWRYTPSAADGDKLRPWLSLLVLADGEFTISYAADSPLPFIDIPVFLEDGTTPNPALDIPSDNIWAWAHVQINKALLTDTSDPDKQDELTEEVNNLINANPDIALSRLVCPRKLEPETNYTAFLIPSFEVGRLAGLGLDASSTAVMKSSWIPTDLATNGAKKMPFYFNWTFSTGVNGDFETMAQELKPITITSLPQKTINIESLGLHFSDEVIAAPVPSVTKTLELGAALMPQAFTLDSWPNLSNADVIVGIEILKNLNDQVGMEVVNLAEDPTVNIPPFYGQHYTNATTLSPTGSSWPHQVNLNPRDRAITALGAKIIKKHQETFMTHAWEKIGQVQEINKQLYQAQLGKEVNGRVFEKQLLVKTDEELIAHTGNLHKKILSGPVGTPKTLSKEVKESNLNNSGTNSGFVKVRRAGGKTAKKLSSLVNPYIATGQRAMLSEDLIIELNSISNLNIQGSLPKPSPYNTGVSSGVFENLAGTSLTALIPKSELTISSTKNTLVEALKPENVLPKKIHNHIKFENTANNELLLPTTDEIKPILAAPKIELPLYQYLVNLSQDFIIPDITDLGNNFVGLLEVDQNFVEKVMLGANHEMSRELLWRGYPTDQRGTIFNYFWDTRDNPNNSIPLKDISDIHTWGTSPIGTHNPSSSAITALVVKGELLQAYPNTVIYAHQAIFNPTPSSNTAPSIDDEPALPELSPVTSIGADRLLNPTINNQTVRYPIFQARLSPNVLVLGFDLSVEELLGQVSSSQPPTLPGWFFMFKERPGEPRFGLDNNPSLPTPLPPLASWDDLAWQYLATSNYVDLTVPLDATNSGVNWNEDAASMAHILYQSPILMGIHASKVINS